MYRGFQLRLTSLWLDSELTRFIDDLKGYAGRGRKMLEADRTTVQNKLKKFLLSDGSLDGSKIQANWFPEIKADVFISHSHQDKNLAFGLAWFLKEHFGLKAFIDSAVWGYANDLLKDIDNKYCLRTGRQVYNYQKRNQSTSHVHMMLSVALNQMIDNTECLFFLNTPNSVSIGASIDGTTPSPWIYSEIAMSRLIRKRLPKRYEAVFESQSPQQHFSSDLIIRYPLPMDHLTELNGDDLLTWGRSCKVASPHHLKALDCLYQLNPLKKDE